MKKISLVVLLVLLGTVLGVASFPDQSMARVFAVFGPETFTRSTKGPVAEVRYFPVQYPDDADFTLHVFYFGIIKDLQGSVPSAVLTLNGKEVVGPNEFNRNVHYIKKPVTLSEGNSLSVELRGKPGSGIRVVITGKNDEPQQFDFSEIVHPDGGNLFGPDLIYDWAILDQPQDGNAILDDPFSPTPSLNVMNVPGEYTLELRVRGESWEESFPIKLAAMDMLTATYNNTPFVPVPVKTRVVTGAGTNYSDYSIQVGSTTYPAPAPTTPCGSPSNTGFQVLVLDRASLAKKDHKTFNVPCGSTSMVNFLNTLDDSSLVIVSSLTTATPFDACGSGSSACPLGAKLIEFGATSIFTSNYSKTLSYALEDYTQAPVNFSYSLIGIKGLGQNEGYELNDWDHKTFDQINISKTYSNIQGSFANHAGTTPKWSFLYTDSVEVQTRAGSTSTCNTILVGGNQFGSSCVQSGALGGFEVIFVYLDNLAQRPWPLPKTYVFSTNFGTGTGSASESEQKRMYDVLNPSSYETGQRYLVVITSIGTPINYKSTYFADLIKRIGNYYGGTVAFLNGLGSTSTHSPTSSYSLVGIFSPGSAAYPLGAIDPVEASLANSNLRVVVQKDKQGWYVPQVGHEEDATTTDRPDFSLLSVAFQPSTPWPLPNPNLSTSDQVYQQQLAAYQYISNNVGEGINNDIRSYYTRNPNDPAKWLSYCNVLQYPTSAPNPYFSQDDFNVMKAQLCGTSGEFNYVDHVNGFKDDMDYVLAQMQISSGTTLFNVYSAVKNSIAPPNDHQVVYNFGQFVCDLLMIKAVTAKSFKAKAVLGVLNVGLRIGMKFSKKSNGSDNTTVNVAVSNLINEMNNLWLSCQAGKDILLDMIKSDWGKLQYVGNKFMTSQDQGGWQYGDTDRNDWVTYITNSLESYYFQSLLPAAWKIDYLQNSTTIPTARNFWYHAGGSWTCDPYCESHSSSNPTAFWADQFSNNTYSWYVLEDHIEMAIMSGCGYMDYSRSVALRDAIFGAGDWCDNAGCHGVKLGLPQPIFYERWLPSSVYTSPNPPNYVSGTGYNGNCSQ